MQIFVAKQRVSSKVFRFQVSKCLTIRFSRQSASYAVRLPLTFVVRPLQMRFAKTTLFLFTLGVLSLVPCTVQPHDAPKAQRTLVLPYDAFGPQAAAYSLIGFEWYQWDSHGDSNPNTKYDVRVVVYRGIPLDQVRKQFPVILGQQDYRYLSYHDALAYCDRLLREYSQLLAHLKQTKQLIRDHFDQ